MELLAGCGSRRTKVIGQDSEWTQLVTLDYNEAHEPDVVHDLRILPWPFETSVFDEIHMYEVLEHLGQQGDYVAFFEQFSEIWRLLKPGGHLMATVPAPGSPWVWGDPSHTRQILPETLAFLQQQVYVDEVGKTAISDFRYLYKADFKVLLSEIRGDTYAFVLEAIKPKLVIV